MHNSNLLKNIESINIIKTMLSNLNEKIKLKISKYNNSFKGFIGINLKNNKFFSNRYIEYEANEKGKEYIGYSDKLINEGEYLNGERNKKEKEYYYEGNFKFEGEYLNGKKWNGKGKEYNDYDDFF